MSRLYQHGARLHRAWWRRRPERRYRPPVPTIGVGSLAFGGVGQTPVSLLLAERARARGLSVWLWQRPVGARRPGVGGLLLPNALADWRVVGDEAAMTAASGQATVVGQDLIGALERALAHHRWPDLLILDNALQCHRVARSIDLALAPAAGQRLRERRLPPGVIQCSAHHRLVGLRPGEGGPCQRAPARVGLVTAFARPERLARALPPMPWLALPDHAPIQPLGAWFRRIRGLERVILSRKDAVKWGPRRQDILVAESRIELRGVRPEQVLDRCLAGA